MDTELEYYHWPKYMKHIAFYTDILNLLVSSELAR